MNGATFRPHGHRTRAAWATLLARSLVLSIIVLFWGPSLDAQAVDADMVRGVAVTAQLEDGGMVPALFRGSRELAAMRSGGSFEFTEGDDLVLILHPGSMWTVDDDARDPPHLAMAIAVHRDDGTIVPGEFRGPSALAQYLHEELAATRGVMARPPSHSLLLAESHARVRVIPGGTAVRTLRVVGPGPNSARPGQRT